MHFGRRMTSQKPTYGELIEMLETAEGEAKISRESVSELLLCYFHKRYPHIPIGRASRFYDTVRRIAAPTQSTRLRKLDGSPLRSYLKRVWMPRIRNTQQGDCYRHKKVSRVGIIWVYLSHRVHTPISIVASEVWYD